VTDSAKSIGGILLAIATIAVCICVEVATVRLFLKAKEVESWPTTQGKVVRSEMAVMLDNYRVHIEYVYQVDDQLYRSPEVRTRGTAGKHRSDVAPLLLKYPLGQEVLVYYNPANPSDAYLEPGVDFVNYVIIISPLFFALLAIGYLVDKFWSKGSMAPSLEKVAT